MSKTPSERLSGRGYSDDLLHVLNSIDARLSAIEALKCDRTARNVDEWIDSHASQLAAQGEQLANIMEVFPHLVRIAARYKNGNVEMDKARQWLNKRGNVPLDDGLTPPAKAEALPAEASEWGPEVVKVWTRRIGTNTVHYKLTDDGVIHYRGVGNTHDDWERGKRGTFKTEADLDDPHGDAVRVYTRPTPTAKGPATSPDAGSVERQAREWLGRDGAAFPTDNDEEVVAILTAFAAQHAASLERARLEKCCVCGAGIGPEHAITIHRGCVEVYKREAASLEARVKGLTAGANEWVLRTTIAETALAAANKRIASALAQLGGGK